MTEFIIVIIAVPIFLLTLPILIILLKRTKLNPIEWYENYISWLLGKLGDE